MAQHIHIHVHKTRDKKLTVSKVAQYDTPSGNVGMEVFKHEWDDGETYYNVKGKWAWAGGLPPNEIQAYVSRVLRHVRYKTVKALEV